MEIKESNHSQRASKTIVIILWVVALLISVGQILRGDIMAMLAPLSVALLGLVIYKVKINTFIEAIILPMIPTIGVIILSYLQGGNARLFLICMFSLALASLYNQKKVLLVFSIIQIIILTTLFISSPTTIMVEELAVVGEFVSYMVILIGVAVVLYFSTKWGDDLIKIAEQSEKEATIISKKLEETGERIKEIIENVSAHSAELSASAEEGSATIETTNNLIDNISAGIQEISASSEEVASFSQEANSQTNLGSKNIEDTVKSIRKINEVVDEAVEVIGNLDNVSKEIEEIVDLITNIAEQTNLLALNAAIEAARAGEHGQGFAVVADEIRELASETATATDKISTLVTETQKQSKKGIEKIKEVELKSKESQEVVEKTGVVFDEIKEAVKETSNQVEQTSNASIQLAEDSGEVKEAAFDIQSMSNEISISAQELADMTQQLQELSKDLKV
ncbi:methyl-accepting chemotaxis protein [Natroniella sp. ANB-PHB2]|uniref:methyl-accepting chemotaxis protein n=1 Tax=Natroniella sp. ANB-PHB2 TaxID=3384444 RepID=UPI0038D48826